MIWETVDWIFPPECVGCGKEGYQICETCRQEIHFLETSQCGVCGKQYKSSGICENCRTQVPYVEELRSLADYEGLIRRSIHRLKYQNDVSLAYELSKFLMVLLESTDWHVDMVIPVPLSKRRLDSRGYNQASLLAFPLALGLKSSFTTKGLARIRETRSQVSLGLHERKENVRNAFLADPKVVKDKVVLLVDDVMTTGATINSAAQALHSAGVSKVFGLTVAKVFSKSVEVENAVSNQV